MLRSLLSNSILTIAVLIAGSACSSDIKIDNEKEGSSCTSFSPENGKFYNVVVVDLYYQTGFISVDGKFLCRLDNKNKTFLKNYVYSRDIMTKFYFFYKGFRSELEKSSNYIYMKGKYASRNVSEGEMKDVKKMVSRDVDPGNAKYCEVGFE